MMNSNPCQKVQIQFLLASLLFCGLPTIAHSRLDPPSETLFALGGEDSRIRVVRVFSSSQAKLAASDYGWPEEVHWSPDRKWVLLRTRSTPLYTDSTKPADFPPLQLLRVDAQTLKLYPPTKSEKFPLYWKNAEALRVRAFDWSSDGRTLVAITVTGEMRLYNLVTGKSRQLRPAWREPDALEAIALSPDGKNLAYVRSSPHRGLNPDWDDAFYPTLRVRSIETGKERTLGYGGDPRWSNDGKRVLCRFGTGIEIREYRVEGKGYKILGKFAMQDCNFAIYSRDGREVLYLDMKTRDGQNYDKRGIYALDLKTKERRRLVSIKEMEFTPGEHWAN